MASLCDRSSETNRENITLIWFDSKIGEMNSMADRMKSLREINDYVLAYNNIEECISYIKSVTDEKLFLITSEIWATILLPPIIDLKQLESVFIYCTWREENLDLMERFSKISGIFTDRIELDANLCKKLRLFNKQVETFSFYDQKQKISINVSERAAEFLWFQLCSNVIVSFPSNPKAKKQMIHACRNYYQGNERALKSIDEFENSYTSENCIQWYTRETFVYKMLNKALRTEDIQQLYTFRFFIADLSLTLAREHNKMMVETDNEIFTTVYRGVRLTLTELEEFRSNEGKLISINGYLSTSRSRSIAINFAIKDKNQSDSVPVLFEIECRNEEETSSVFADITNFSDFPDEQEVLFDLGAVFKVQSVTEEDDLWKISLSVTGEGQEIARQYIEETKNEMQGNSVSILFGSLLTRMGHYQAAQTYFQQLLREPGNENLAYIHNQLGLVCQANAEYEQAMHHFDVAYQLMRKSHPSLLRESTHILRNMSHVLVEQGQYEEALKYCNRAKQILEEFNDLCQLEMAHCLHNIGSCYRGLRKYREALNYYEQALNIKRACLPKIHVHIAETVNSIGVVHLMTKDSEKAFNFFLSSFQIYEACLPEDHSDIANVLHNIADVYQTKSQHEKALNHYYLALAMKKKCFPSDHPAIAATLNSISTVLSAKGEKVKALELCLQALKMRERVLPFDHPDLAISFSSAGHKYEAMEENQLALEYFEKAWKIRAKIFPEDDPARKRSVRHVVRMKWKTT
ncbi:unnamed protein product [Rotaria socialis]|uniref:NAD(P)(+)--arginine ADP-ribosyltransferase n=2 Tax=Rotaria socialis TaxID=392032 RepID=A0A820Q0Z6_9BILA|nr:unnamed protein product [Rotaria socialis]CAF3753876.1 unnamed protein product [Rotaria socialis]CAF4411664.1 unnamed protein product [Rotaria socialis]CAF4476879.1 unnamed protein product [Rotaria socialis]CAF4628639.1 unnamed protein product [Rotaria socialis]